MASTTKAAPRKTATKRTTSPTNGTKATKTTRRTKKPKTANEAILLAWQHDYETRHPESKRRG